MGNSRFKFRVWDKEGNKMFTPPRHFNYCIVNGTIVCVESFCQYSGFYQKRIIKEFNDAILMQCTGLKDKNGKLIYEGDILYNLFSNYKYVVNFGKFTLNYTKPFSVNITGFYITYKENIKNEIDSLQMLDLNNIEVIGNIYENPELLED